MDSTGFPPHNMGGPNQAMQMQQQAHIQQQQRQQQQQRAGGPQPTQQQMHAMIFQNLSTQTGPLSGWQSQVAMSERVGLIYNLLRLASAGQATAPGPGQMMQIGIKFEKEIFDRSIDKAAYKRALDEKLQQLLERRNQNQTSLQHSINQQAQAQAAQNQQAQMMMQNGMHGQQSRAMGQQPSQQGFQHLQHQMQATPLPGQQPHPQMGMGMGNDSLPLNMGQNHQQQQFQMAMQQAQQQQQNGMGRPLNGQNNFNQPDSALLMELANRLLNQTSMEERVALKNRLLESMTPQVLQDLQMRGQDPLIMYFRQQALQRLRNDKQLRIQQAQQQLAMSQQAQGLPNGAPMQQQRSMNPSPLNGQSQLAAGMGTNSDFNFLNNMDNLAAQQKQAAMAAEAGQVVVPANAAQRNGTPQPGAMSGQQLNMGMNGQQGVPNQMNAAQQQQIRNNQQLQQQQRLAQQQTHQAQIQARMNAQKMGLQGQPGGMGNGPMPPQQSPALPTLNAPLRTPSQMGHQDSPQVNPNSHFGQQLDPRFAQANNRGLMGPGAGMNAGFNPQQLMASMSREQQQKVGQLPPDKLQEVLMKLNEQRAMNSANPQRPQMQQGNNQIQPGMQVPQGNQFGMPGQRPAQLNGSNMTPQQQIALQEQIARLQQNPQQRQPLPPHMEQNIVRTMDGVDFPSNLHNHGSFPQGVPPEIKKWGPLKVWVQQNQNSIAPEVPETLRQLQRIHWQAMVRGRNSTVQAGQAGGMQPGIQGGQAGMPGMPMSAPVAPMTQNAMQQPPGMNMAGLGQIRQPTQQEIQNARQHPSGRMAAATDDQIRQFLMQQQRHRQQMMQNMQMQNQMPQLNMQQGRSGQQPQMANARPAVQPPAQPNQPKQMPPNVNTPNAANNNLQNANRNARPAANSTQNGPQNSSPAQPSKSLKRSQSDDVIEVPNPNISQPSRQPVQQAHAAQQNQQTLQNQAGNAQQNQGQKPVVPPGRPSLNLTPQQVAALDPEARKKHDLGVRLARAEQKIKAFASDEQEKSDNTQFVPVPMNADTKASVQTMLKEILTPLMNMSRAMPRYYMISQDEKRARTFYALKSKIARQFQDPQMSQMKDSLSISLKDIENARMFLNDIVNDLSQRHPTMKKSLATVPQPAPTSQSTAPNNAAQALSTAPSTVPLNAANLQEQQQQLNKMHHRSGSRSNVPAAPTQTHAPYQFGSAKSPPDGVPAYDRSYALKNNLTQENLQLPAHKNKKQRPNSNAPGQNSSANASPQVSKTPISPDMKRQISESKLQAKPSLCCSEPECERHNVGFDNEEALRQHTQEEHIKPLSNPLQYAQQNLASSLGLDNQGRQQHQVAAKQSSTQPPTAAKMAQSVSKQGQTPTMKAGNTPASSTPMHRQASMNRQPSGAGARPATPAKGTPLKDGASNEAKQTAPVPEPVIEDPWANATIDPNDLFQAFQPFESGAGGAISDMNVYRSITPNDTPESSKDSGVSEPNSDISEGVGLDISLDLFGDNSWEPFGSSDANMLFDMDNFGASKDVDAMMFDDPQAPLNLSWDDVVDPSAFDKPFSFDTSYYSMNAD